MKSLTIPYQAALGQTPQRESITIWADTTGKLWAQKHGGAPLQINIVPAPGTEGQTLKIVNGVPAWAT